METFANFKCLGFKLGSKHLTGVSWGGVPGFNKTKGALLHSLERCLAGNISGAEIIKLSSCSIQLSMKFILLINLEIPTIVNIINIYEQDK